MEEHQEKPNQDDLFSQEEQCQKTIRTVGKALFMRIVVAALMIWVAVSNRSQIWAWGLAAFVLLVDLTGAVVLWKEFSSQRKRLKELIAQEEN